MKISQALNVARVELERVLELLLRPLVAGGGLASWGPTVTATAEPHPYRPFWGRWERGPASGPRPPAYAPRFRGYTAKCAGCATQADSGKAARGDETSVFDRLPGWAMLCPTCIAKTAAALRAGSELAAECSSADPETVAKWAGSIDRAAQRWTCVLLEVGPPEVL